MKKRLAQMVRPLRALFGLLGFDVTAYSDVDLVDAVLYVAPEVHVDWPTDDDVRRAFERLSSH